MFVCYGVRGRLKTAHTLVELLVVIATVGVLSSILLPAVQTAREASRVASCKNNLKQLGLGLFQYEQSHRALPAGARSSTGSTHGISWCVEVASYLEESAMMARFDKVGSNSGWLLLHPRNGAAVDGVVIRSMVCPSTPLPILYPVGSFRSLMPSYVGISGASNEDGFREGRVNTCCLSRNDGQIAAGGLLVPNRSIAIKETADGTSKTLAIGESSDFLFDGTTAMRADGGMAAGWTMGTKVSGTPPKYFEPYPSWNITTIRYSINSRDYRRAGIDQDHGPNNPLVSAHCGGVNVLWASGAVGYLLADTDLDVLKRFATRDDSEIALAFP